MGVRLAGAVAVTLAAVSAAAQPPPAVDVTAADITSFIDALPDNRISDRPIRIADVGGYNVGVYGAFRPGSQAGRAILHDTSVTEVYYMLEGSGTLVTGGMLLDREGTGNSPNTGTPNYRGTGIEGGRSRKVVPGDVVIIPGRTHA